MGIALIQTGPIIRLNPINAKTGKIISSTSIPIGSEINTNLLRELAKALAHIADVLDLKLDIKSGK